MEVVLRIDTRLPTDVKLVRELPATEISVKVHGPACLLQYLATDEVVQDVFGR